MSVINRHKGVLEIPRKKILTDSNNNLYKLIPCFLEKTIVATKGYVIFNKKDKSYKNKCDIFYSYVDSNGEFSNKKQYLTDEQDLEVILKDEYN